MTRSCLRSQVLCSSGSGIWSSRTPRIAVVKQRGCRAAGRAIRRGYSFLCISAPDAVDGSSKVAKALNLEIPTNVAGACR